VGHLAVQIAKARGAGSVAAVCSGKNAAFVRSLGADDVVDYTRSRSAAETGAAVDTTGAAGRAVVDTDADTVVRDLQDIVEARGGAPFDVVIDTVSSHDARDAAWEYERRIRAASDPPLVASVGLCTLNQVDP
jgi:NADPH:quinone reductase-like Zn-dependent oxidoreductase